jgi:protein-tyrosine-phosphatase
MQDLSIKKKTKILTVCTGNICRSPMAEGILRMIFQANPPMTISSAGTHAIEGNPATEFSLLASMEKGVDITGHRARPLDGALIRSSNIILCMEPSHVEWVISHDSFACRRVYNLADYSGTIGSAKIISDPYGCSLREYRVCFAEISKSIYNFIVAKREIIFSE